MVMYMKLNKIVNRLIEMQNSLSTLEKTVLLYGDYYKNKIKQHNAYQTLLDKGMDGLKKRILEENKLMLSKRKILFLRTDQMKQLRQPHRKIIDYLANQYDHTNRSQKEVHYSKLVKDCKIGKNKANDYLKFLTDNGLVSRRNDGYRVWLKYTGNSVSEGGSD